ncbi:DUF2842 domain-containing protein [Cognatishimia sp.]|uniref:DUF2842 domain-containing protein n=1 Tax=Cognatishimia sp. TaxID=2211648 RepID=UPI003512C6FD|nr:DUF2842 domain-containing protein [Cognatishimia sp.]
MALSYKARRRWAILILVVGLPIYIILATVLATTVVRLLGDSSLVFLLQLVIYVGLGIAWILPFKSIFLGIGQADPDADPEE